MSDVNAVLALKNAWTSVVSTSERVRDLAPAVEALPEGVAVAEIDLDAYHAAVFAQANAVMALRGLIERLRELKAQAIAQ